jgi:hypothetical protein
MQVLVKTKDPSFEGNTYLLLSSVVDPDPHQIERQGRIRFSVKGRIRIRIRIKVKSRIRIRIRIKVIPRNTAVERDMKKH